MKEITCGHLRKVGREHKCSTVWNEEGGKAHDLQEYVLVSDLEAGGGILVCVIRKSYIPPVRLFHFLELYRYS